MTRLKRLPVAAVPAVAVLVGFGCAVVGLFLLAGLAVTLLAAGVVLVVGGLVVDLG
jgi:hypothetical protein